MRPVAVAPMRARHVVGERGRPIRAVAAQMGRDQLAAVEDLHRLRRDAGFDLFAEQPERHRIRMMLNSTIWRVANKFSLMGIPRPLPTELTAVKPHRRAAGRRRRRA